MTPSEVASELKSRLGLPGWRGVVAAMDETHDWAAAIHSPDYVPGVRPVGLLVAERGQDAFDALARAARTAHRRLGEREGETLQ